MALYRVKARWSGFTGSPGYSIFHFDTVTEPNAAAAKDVADDVSQFFLDIGTLIPSSARVDVESAVEVIEETTGQLVELFNITAMPGAAGGASGSFAAAAGACITWDTGGIRKGRRVRGRTFLVPLGSSAAFESNGTLAAAAMTTMTSSANKLLASRPDFHVFARPSGPGASDGQSFAIRSPRIADKVAVLRSRRD